ncbi:hypothetical protein [Salibacterium sp. K-3]
MKEKQLEFLTQIRSMGEELTHKKIEYWKSFSDFEIWQFLVLILTLIVPLIMLFIFIDKDKMLLLGFFGLNYYVWFAYINATGISLGVWE